MINDYDDERGANSAPFSLKEKLMSLKKTLIGAGVGFIGGCALMAARNTVTLTCPVLWIPGGAAGCGVAAYQLSNGNVPVTAAASVVGAAIGTAEVLAYPITMPMNLAQNAMLPIIGTVVGGVIGYKE